MSTLGGRTHFTKCHSILCIHTMHFGWIDMLYYFLPKSKLIAMVFILLAFLI